MSRKAAAVTEDELLQRRLSHAHWLSGMLQDRGSLAAQTVAAYTDLLDELVMDVAVEAHREDRTGVLLPHGDARHEPRNGAAHASNGGDGAPEEQQQQQQARPQALPPLPGVKGPTDMFGQVHPGTATDIVVCRNCGRKAQAGKFAYHLEKCLGKGRQGSGRQTSRRTGT